MSGKRVSYDIILRNGLIVDGTGTPAWMGDIAVQGKHIVKIGALTHASAHYAKDVKGLMIAPGFIDVHAHDDRAVLVTPAMLAKLSQGVTSVISGHCGISLAPLVLTSHPPSPLSLLSDTAWYRFASVADYVAAVAQAQPNINVALLIGHTTLRVGAMADLGQKANARQRAHMQQHVCEGLQAGAMGLSSDLSCPLTNSADRDEMLALLEPVAYGNGIYTTHLHDEYDDVMNALQESFTLAQLANVPVVISQHKCAGRNNWGRSVETLRLIYQLQRKQNISLDVSPYTAYVSAIIPSVVDSNSDSDILITDSQPYPEMAGNYLREIARGWGCTQRQAAQQLYPGSACYFTMDEEDVRRILKYPNTMIGSGALADDRHPYPGLWGSFSRVIGRYSRELRLFTIEEAIRKMTSLPARQFCLDQRGILCEGSYADIVVFNPDTLIDTATFAQPLQSTRGMKMVIVNGRIAWQDGQATGARAGEFIRRAASTDTKPAQ